MNAAMGRHVATMLNKVIPNIRVFFFLEAMAMIDAVIPNIVAPIKAMPCTGSAAAQ